MPGYGFPKNSQIPEFPGKREFGIGDLEIRELGIRELAEKEVTSGVRRPPRPGKREFGSVEFGIRLGIREFGNWRKW